MKSIYLFVMFIVLAVFQLFTPTKMILDQEAVLKKGIAYKFKTQPVDPSDPFRGKYITLSYDISSFKTNDSLWERNQPVYVYLTTDSLGFAKINSVSKTVLLNNQNDFIKAKVGWYYTGDKTLNMEFPFNRYYMEESKAYDAEVAVREAQQDSLPNNTYALVYVKNGETVLKDVRINEISIKDYVNKEKP